MTAFDDPLHRGRGHHLALRDRAHLAVDADQRRGTGREEQVGAAQAPQLFEPGIDFSDAAAGGHRLCGHEVVELGMADVLLGTMRPSARGDDDRRRGHYLLTRGHDVSTLFHRHRGPRAEGTLGGDAGHDQGRSRAAARRSPRARPGTARQGPGPDGGDHVEPDVERARPPFDQGVAREGGLARLVAAQDPAPARLELGGRLLDGPVVGPHHQHRGRRPGGGRPAPFPLVQTPIGAPSIASAAATPRVCIAQATTRPTADQPHSNNLGREAGRAGRALGCREMWSSSPFTKVGQRHYARWSRPVVAVVGEDQTVARNSERRTRSAPQQSRPSSCGRLLVVDDDPEVRGMLVRLLEVRGLPGHRGRHRRRGHRQSRPAPSPTSSSSTSCSPPRTGSTCWPPSAGRATCPSSWSRPEAASPTGSSASSSAPTTTS